ncbi:phosphomannomutase/phosphoglucomutase [Candidatus Gracilibacteria bacterium]|nr:phosphomannomutase/phosphoglucomutase [Candidatus Gracilibacteria bacterium]MCF7819163.1 phosphomannomutase/phosphoglucomutase [Candidatus Gracilibacteria bacterium]
MILKSKIFRAYDIRGEAFVDFDEDGFFSIAAAFGKYLQKKHSLKNPKIFVSGDGRISMIELWPAVVAGLQSVGCTVTWGGTIPTPVNSFALHAGSFDATIQITASHNPSSDNGLKLNDQEGAVCGDEIQKIKNLAVCNECRETKDFGECVGECEVVSFVDAYTQKLKAITPAQTAQKIVIDCGNGVPGLFYPKILKDFGHDVIELYCDLNGHFPNHQPDPEEPENLRDLKTKVYEVRADFGVAFDGDGDRLGIILSDGTILSADKILYILAADFLRRNPREKIIVDAMSSATLIEKIKKLGGKLIVSKTGHSHIMQKMKEEKALLGGEQSGHEFFGEDFYGHDDAMLAMLRFLSAVQDTPTLLQEVTESWPKMQEFSEKFKTSDEEKFEIVKNVATQLVASLQDKNDKIDTLDGIRIDFGGGEWAIIRCSNTSPKIAVRIEAKDEKSLEEKKELLVGTLKKYL